MSKPMIGSMTVDVKFRCFGCGLECGADKKQGAIYHVDPPCEEFLKDRPLDEFVRECRLKMHAN